MNSAFRPRKLRAKGFAVSEAVAEILSQALQRLDQLGLIHCTERARVIEQLQQAQVHATNAILDNGSLDLIDRCNCAVIRRVVSPDGNKVHGHETGCVETNRCTCRTTNLCPLAVEQ